MFCKYLVDHVVASAVNFNFFKYNFLMVAQQSIRIALNLYENRLNGEKNRCYGKEFSSDINQNLIK